MAMNILALLILSCLVGGCVTRHPTKEPDTEWILSQYQGQDESIVNARRIKEGW